LNNNDLKFHVYGGRHFFNDPVPWVSSGAGVADPAVVKQTKKVPFFIEALQHWIFMEETSPLQA